MAIYHFDASVISRSKGRSATAASAYRAAERVVDRRTGAVYDADVLDHTAMALGEIPTGRIGRVTGTYEKSVTGLPYVIAYALMPHNGVEAVAIVRVIHTSRDWPDEEWPH